MSEKDILEYRPQLSYKKERHIELENKTLENQLPDIKLSPIIEEMLEVSPAQLFQDYDNLKNRAKGIINKIVDDLRNQLAKGPSVDEYIRARENNDANTMYAFEDFHDGDIEGNTAAEMLPVIMNLAEEAEALQNLVNNFFLENSASSDNISDIVSKEERNIEETVKLAQQGKADIDRIAEDNHIKEFFQEKAEVMDDHLNQTEDILNQDIHSAYGGQTKTIVDSLAQNSNLIEQVKDANEQRFHKYARKSIDAKNRMNRLSNLPSKLALIEEVRKLQLRKLDNRSMMQWMENAEVNEDDPSSLFFLDILEGISDMNDESDELVKGLYGLSQLDDIQMNDFFESLHNKQVTRDVHSLSKNMENSFDFKSKDREQQMKQFGKNTGIDVTNKPVVSPSPSDKQHNY